MASGHLVYIHEGTLFAVPFNPDRLELKAQPVPVLENVTSQPAIGASQFGFSETGVLAYLSGGIVNSTSSLWYGWIARGQPRRFPRQPATTPIHDCRRMAAVWP